MSGASISDLLMAVVQIYLCVVVVDLLLGWIQPDPSRWPRRLFHLVTEPPQRLLRPISRLAGWDWSPLVLIALLGALRVALDRA